MHKTTVLCLCLAAAAASAAEQHDHVSEASGVRILHAWTAARGGEAAQVYLEVENTGDVAQTLVGGETDIADEVTLVASPIRATGEAEPLDSVAIEAGGGLALEPQGLFLRLTGLDRVLTEGETFPMEVHLDPAGHVEVEVQVEAHDATAHSHAGHSH